MGGAGLEALAGLAINRLRQRDQAIERRGVHRAPIRATREFVQDFAGELAAGGGALGRFVSEEPVVILRVNPRFFIERTAHGHRLDAQLERGGLPGAGIGRLQLEAEPALTRRPFGVEFEMQFFPFVTAIFAPEQLLAVRLENNLAAVRVEAILRVVPLRREVQNQTVNARTRRGKAGGAVGRLVVGQREHAVGNVGRRDRADSVGLNL